MTRYQDGFTVRSAAPSNPDTGDLWFDTLNNQIKRWNGTAWAIFTPKPPKLTTLAADFSTGSATPVDFLSTTFTPSGTTVLLQLSGFASATQAATLSFFSLAVGATSKPIGAINASAGSAQFPFAGSALFAGLTPGVSVTVKAQVAANSGTFQCRTGTFPTYEGASLTAVDVPS